MKTKEDQMPLDLKAKAERIAEDIIQNSESWWLGADEIVSLCKEVQDATRRETIRECAEILEQNYADTFDVMDGYKDIIALLTTPEKIVVDVTAQCMSCQTPDYGHFHCGKCGLVGSTTIENISHFCPEKKEG